MKIVSFNVNSLRLRIPQLKAIIDRYDPDFIGLQETKVQDADFPLETINNELGYQALFMGQKTHYGVALLSKTTAEETVYGFPEDDSEAQKRFIGGCFQNGSQKLYIYNGYFPQGESRDHPVKFPAKQKFYADLNRFLSEKHNESDPIVVMGDFNIAPVDQDIGIGADNAKRWLKTGKTSFLPEEREWFEQLTRLGLTDSYRAIYPEVADRFSWFDYRSRGFEREPRRGLRIDHIMVSKPLKSRVQDAGIDYDVRAMEKPSDHAPVWLDLSTDG